MYTHIHEELGIRKYRQIFDGRIASRVLSGTLSSANETNISSWSCGQIRFYYYYTRHYVPDAVR